MASKFNKLKLNLRLQQSERLEQINEVRGNINQLKNFVRGISPGAVISILTNIISQKEKNIIPYSITESQTLNTGLFISNIIPRVVTSFKIFDLRLAKVAFASPDLTLRLGLLPNTVISVVTIINNIGGEQTIDLSGPYQIFFPEQQYRSNIPNVTQIKFTSESQPGDNVSLTYINRQNLLLVPGIRVRTNTPHLEFIM